MIDVINIEQFSSIVRILFCIIFFNKIYFSIKGFDFHWAHIENIKERKLIYFLLCLSLFFLVLLFVGFLTKFSSVIILLIYFYTFIRSSLFSLEDTYLSSLSIYVALSNNFYFSLDKLLGLNNMIFNSYFFNIQLFPEMIVSIFFSLIFFSSACEKLRSKMWRSGLAVKYFFIHPKFRKVNLEFLGNRKLFSTISGMIVMSSQGLIFFCLFFPSKYGLIVLFSLLVFSLILSIFFLYVGLAEACILLLLTQSCFFVFLWDMSVLEYLLINFNNFSVLEECLLFFTLILSFIFFINQLFPQKYETIVFKNSFFKWIFKLPRIFLGLGRVGVYTEEHLSNPIAFRVFATSKNNRVNELFQLYNDDGTPYLKKVILLPCVFMCIAFKIHDILIELDEKGRLSPSNSKFFDGYIRFLLKEENIDFTKIENITFNINQLNIDEAVKKNIDLNKKMIPLLELKIVSNFNIIIRPLKNKLLNYSSVRKRSERYKM